MEEKKFKKPSKELHTRRYKGFVLVPGIGKWNVWTTMPDKHHITVKTLAKAKSWINKR